MIWQFHIPAPFSPLFFFLMSVSCSKIEKKKKKHLQVSTAFRFLEKGGYCHIAFTTSDIKALSRRLRWRQSHVVLRKTRTLITADFDWYIESIKISDEIKAHLMNLWASIMSSQENICIHLLSVTKVGFKWTGSYSKVTSSASQLGNCPGLSPGLIQLYYLHFWNYIIWFFLRYFFSVLFCIPPVCFELCVNSCAHSQVWHNWSGSSKTK